MDTISEQTLQENIQELDNENRQLKDTITALREELEKSNVKEEMNKEKILAQAGLQIQELKDSILAIRQQLEMLHIESENRVQEKVQIYEAEVKQLKATITQLRTELEERNKK